MLNIKRIFYISVLLLVPFVSLAQWDDCSQGKTDGSCEYPGECGQYTDINNDKICDHSQKKPTEQTVVSQKNKIAIEKVVPADITKDSDTAKDKKLIKEELLTKNTVDNLKISSSNKKLKKSKNKYPLLNIVVVLSLFYGLTYFFAKRKIIKSVTHKKIWNVLLTISFLAMAILSILLIIQINSGKTINLGINILYWHVITGIIMTIITLFSIEWHWRYYKNLFK